MEEKDILKKDNYILTNDNEILKVRRICKNGLGTVILFNAYGERGNRYVQDIKINNVIGMIEQLLTSSEKKDNIIDLMANYIYITDCESEYGNTRNQVKQYFEDKAEKDKK